MIGERSGRIFQLAGRVRVNVARVDLETAKIDFTLAEDSGSSAAVRRARSHAARAAPPRKEIAAAGRPRGADAASAMDLVLQGPTLTTSDIAAFASLAGAQGIHVLAGGRRRPFG